MSSFIGTGPQGAVFSDDRLYRYSLWRRWDEYEAPAHMLLFVGLNPSTADETHDDPTIRRCIGFAKQHNFGGIAMANLFAFRATDPAVMRKTTEPVGDLNDVALRSLHRACAKTICCWGSHGGHLNRSSVVRGMLMPHAWHFGLTSKGQPKHPLYLPASSTLIRWERS